MAAIIPLHKHAGATADDWSHLDMVLGLTADLLPVVSNPRAQIAPTSHLKDIGKTPSWYNGQRQITGIANWTGVVATPKLIARWSKERDYGICVQTRRVRALDVDVTDPEQAAEIAQFIAQRIALPRRHRPNSSKFLLAFDLPGQFSKRRVKTAHGMIEFLATGQQFICCGTHPSGVRYEWENGLPDAFPSMDAGQFEVLWAELVATFGIEDASASAPSVKAQKLSDVLSNDPVAQFLMDKSLVLRAERDGRLHITCPFEEDHTSEGSDSATTYFPAHTGGYVNGHFECLHAHCQHRTDQQFKDALGFADTSMLSEFEAIAAAPVAAPTPTPEPQPAEPEDVSAEFEAIDDIGETISDVADLIGEDPPYPPPVQTHRFQVVPAGEFARRPPPQWIVKGILPRAELAVVFGESGSGKTFWVLDLAAAVARGESWRGRTVKRGRVVYIAAEGAGGFRNRLAAYAHAHDIKLSDLPIGVIPDAPNLMEKADALDVAKAIQAAGGADVVIVDTLAQTVPGANENSGEDMGRALAHCKGIHRATKALVILVHHSGKDSSKGARGWSGLRAAADAEIEIVRTQESRSATITKLKDGGDGEELGFKLSSVVLGLDADGEEISSCVIAHNDEGARKRGRERKLGAVEQIVLAAVDKLSAVAGGADERDVAEEARNQMAPDPGKKDTRWMRVRRALDSLVAAGRIRVFEGRVEIT